MKVTSVSCELKKVPFTFRTTHLLDFVVQCVSNGEYEGNFSETLFHFVPSRNLPKRARSVSYSQTLCIETAWSVAFPDNKRF
jgi:hypothetical protein